MKNKICGWGINDADFQTWDVKDKGGRQTPTYQKWHDMVSRVFDKKQLIRDPKYEDVSICKEWQYFTNFHYWMNNYIGNITGLQLDKDIYIPGNKIYSPDTCCFVSGAINNLFRTGSRNKKSSLPKFIYRHGYERYKAEYRSKYLGSGKDIEKLLELVKVEQIKDYEQLAEQQTDERIFTGLLRHADLLRFGTYDF